MTNTGGASQPKIVRCDGARAFLRRAEAWLLRREAENTLLLGVADSLSGGAQGYESPLYFATIERGGEVQGCAFRTPPYKLGLTRMPVEAAPLVASDVAEVYESLPAVLGPPDIARRVGRAWAAIKGVRAADGARQRIHSLERVRPPVREAAGGLRLADESDLALVASWIRSFVGDTGAYDMRDPEPRAEHLVASKCLALWVDRVPVSMAAFRTRTRNTARVSLVYTPDEHRRRGYASALVAQVSRHLLDSGCRWCVLYTDLANPTANKIYRAIGYRPVQDVMDVNFS